MVSAKNTAIYSKEMTLSKNKNDLVFISYDFRNIIKEIILKSDTCINKSFNFEYNGFHINADVLCEDNIAFIDTFMYYKDVSFSHREIINRGSLKEYLEVIK